MILDCVLVVTWVIAIPIVMLYLAIEKAKNFLGKPNRREERFGYKTDRRERHYGNHHHG